VQARLQQAQDPGLHVSTKELCRGCSRPDSREVLNSYSSTPTTCKVHLIDFYKSQPKTSGHIPFRHLRMPGTLHVLGGSKSPAARQAENQRLSVSPFFK
jgi:hypothetical protein